MWYAAGVALDVPCVVPPELSEPMPGQLPWWFGAAGVPGVVGAGVAGCAEFGTVVLGVSVCADALNGFSTVSANDALAMPNAVMPAVTAFLMRCTLS